MDLKRVSQGAGFGTRTEDVGFALESAGVDEGPVLEPRSPSHSALDDGMC